MNNIIVIDLSFIRRRPYAGVAKYAYRIVDYIQDSCQTDKYILLLDNVSAPALLKKYKKFEYIIIGNKIISRIPILRTIWMMMAFKKVTNNYGVVFCPWGNIVSCLKTKAYKISVIHDLQTLIDLRGFSRLVEKKIVDAVVKNSNQIVTISNFSKKQILTIYPNQEVLNWGNSVSMPSQNLTSCGIESHYLLYVGRICEMKNLKTLVLAFAQISRKIDDRILVIVGRKNDYWKEVIFPLIQSRKLEDRVVVLENISENRLASIYKKADLFVFPSLREGFGFPPIEAAIMEIPVITSLEESLKEVTMNLLYYVNNPLDENELARVMFDVLSNPPSREHLLEIKRAYEDVYSPNVVCKRICEFLESISDKV